MTRPRDVDRGARRRRGVLLVVAIAVSLATAAAGRWQLRRGHQKEAWQAQREARGQLPPLGGAELARDEAAAAEQVERRVRLQGRWLAARTVFLDNRPMDGRAGFIVVTPLLLSAHDAVLVQRGWVARDPRDRNRLPDLPTPSGPVELSGRVAPHPSRTFALGVNDVGVIRQNLDAVAYGREIGVALRPVTVWQDDAPGTAADGLLRHWAAPATGVERHYGYAVQWFAMSALSLGLYVWFQVWRPWQAARAAA